MKNYTKEQTEDIKAREKKALEYLKKNNLTPAAIMQKIRIGNENGEEVWADKVIPYLQDFKHSGTISPIQNNDIKKN